MGWISGTKRSADGNLLLIVHDADGNSSLAEPSSKSLELPTTGTETIRMSIRLDRLVVDDPECFVRAVGIKGAEASRQSAYWSNDKSQQLCIPAQVLVRAMLAPHKIFQKILLTPRGTEALMCLIRDEDRLTVQPNPFTYPRGYNPKQSLKRHIAWIQLFPSVTRAWASVYTHALNGKFDMNMPDATIDALVRVLSIDGKLYAMGMTALAFTQKEDAHEFAKDIIPQGMKLSLSRDISAPRKKTSFKTQADGDSRFSEIAKQEALTDSQWLAVEQILRRHSVIKENANIFRVKDLRTIVFTLLRKLGHPYRWCQVPAHKKTIGSAYRLYTAHRNSGMLDELATVLLK